MSKRKLRAIVTAGSTVIKRDEVRVFEMLPYVSGEHIPTLFKGIHVELRNILRGKLGAFIVNELASRDVETTLITRKDLLKPALKNSRLNYTVKEFYTFEDLYETLQSSVAEVKPDIILMAAAVSDYTKKPESGKISSDLDKYSVT